MKLKLYRDKVVSVVRGRDLVGVYIKYPHINCEGDSKTYYSVLLLAEMSPTKADKIIKLWNSK